MRADDHHERILHECDISRQSCDQRSRAEMITISKRKILDFFKQRLTNIHSKTRCANCCKAGGYGTKKQRN